MRFTNAGEKCCKRSEKSIDRCGKPALFLLHGSFPLCGLHWDEAKEIFRTVARAKAERALRKDAR